MGTLTSYVGAIFVGRPPGKGSTGFCWINIMHAYALLNWLTLITAKPPITRVFTARCDGSRSQRDKEFWRHSCSSQLTVSVSGIFPNRPFEESARCVGPMSQLRDMSVLSARLRARARHLRCPTTMVLLRELRTDPCPRHHPLSPACS